MMMRRDPDVRTTRAKRYDKEPRLGGAGIYLKFPFSTTDNCFQVHVFQIHVVPIVAGNCACNARTGA